MRDHSWGFGEIDANFENENDTIIPVMESGIIFMF